MPNKYPKKRSREETEVAVFLAVCTAADPVSRKEIADAIERAKTPELIEIIEAFVTEGFFDKIEDRARNGTLMYRYRGTEKCREPLRRLGKFA